jgi:hypothetical protein
MTTHRVVLGILLLIASLGLTSCASSPAKRTSSVPWLSLPPLSTTTTTTTTTTLAPALSCVARNLKATVGQGGAGLGNELSVLIFTNTGPLCRLSGYPNLEGRTATHGPAQIGVRKSGTYFGNLIPADLASGQRGALLLGTADACTALNSSPSTDATDAHADTYHAVTVLLPDGSGTVVFNKVTFDAACGLDESQLGVQPPTASEISAPPGSLASLQASNSMPSRVQSGKVLRYSVTLYNPTNKTVTWQRCPNYTELILVVPDVGKLRRFSHTYELNCAQAKNLAPRHSDRFTMELFLGKVQTSSEAKFSWALDTGDGPYSGRGIYVLADR